MRKNNQFRDDGHAHVWRAARYQSQTLVDKADRLWCAKSRNPVQQEGEDDGIGVTVDQRNGFTHHRTDGSA